MNNYFFLQRGELVDLANGELRSLVRTYQPRAKINNVNSRVLLVSGDLDIEKVTARAACTKLVGKLLQVSNKVTGFELNGIMKNCKTFACDLVNLSKQSVDMQVLSDLGNYVKQQAPWLNVSLENPDVTFTVIKTETESVIGIVERNKSVKWRSESRRKRPYFHPVALEPRLCRAMINLAMVSEDNTILDPFCGTGSVMLEANNMKINSIGCDLSSKMCRGALTNLRNSKNSFLINCDALSLPLKIDSVDAIVTDLPYGMAASTQKRKPEKLLNEFLDVIKTMKGRRCCIMCRKGDEHEFPNMVEQYDIYEHKNLTRKLMVLCN